MKRHCSLIARLLGTHLLLLLAAEAAAEGRSRGSGASDARATSERPNPQNIRYKEDWSLIDSAGEQRFLDPIKYIPFDEDGDYWLSLGGQVRGRLAVWRDFLFGGSQPRDDDEIFLFLLRLHADLHLTEYVRIYAEFKSSYATERELAGGPRGSDFDAAELQNAFLELKLPVEAVDLGIFGGRREMEFGAQRLVSPLLWSNVRRTFDGAELYAGGESWRASGFWTLPVLVSEYDFNHGDDDLQFYGIYSTFDGPLASLDMDLYWLGLSFENARASNGTFGSGNRQTIGARIFGEIPATPLSIDMEGAAQVGSVSGNDIRAGMFSTKITWPFETAPWKPSLYTGYDWASGDSGRGGKVQTFDQLYPLAHAYLGFIDTVGRQNIHAVHAGVEVSPLTPVLFAMTWHAFWLDDVNDALYAAAGNPIRFDPTASSKQVGVEVDVVAKVVIVAGLEGLLGYSHFFSGKYLSQSGAHRDVDFGYLQLQYTF